MTCVVAGPQLAWLGGQIGTAYSKGFQTGKGEDGGKFLLGVITLKHWAGYTVEEDRSGYNSIITPFDLQDSYLPAFRAAVRDGKAGTVCRILSPTLEDDNGVLTSTACVCVYDFF